MTLDAGALADALEAVFLSMPDTAADAADALADAYNTFASAGTFGASTLALTGAEKPALASTLATSLALPGLPATHAAAWAAGVAAFWAGVPVVGAQSGATVGCPGAASLTATLTAVFANLANTAATCAAAMAAALATATATVTATVAPPPGTVLPIA